MSINRVIHHAYTWTARILAVAAVLILGKSTPIEAVTADVHDEGLNNQLQLEGVDITYADLGTLEESDDDFLPRTE